ncbi:retrovirus-related pol polyprotein from transposon TNT 1-94 [Tanacetum coccineum]
MIKKFIALAQLNYKAKVCKIRTDNVTEFKNATLKDHYEKLGIMQQFSIARTPQQNGIVERRNRTLVEAARTMLIFSRLPYELLRGIKPNVEYFHVFGSLCYPTNDRDDLGKMKLKADIGVFIGYSETSRGFRIYNRRTKRIMETIHVKFDELRLEPRSDKESPEVEIVQEKVEESKDTEVEPNIVIPVNVDDEEDEITDEVFELRRRAKGKNVEESRISPIPSPTRSPRNLSTVVSPDTEKLQELTTSRDQLADNLHDVMMETLPSLVKEKVTEQVKKEVHAQVRDQVPVYLAEVLILERKTIKEEMERLISKAILQERGRMQAHISSQIQNAIDNAIPSLFDASVRSYISSAVRTRDQDDPHDDAHPEGENSAKRQKTSEYEAYVSGESSSGHVNVEEPGPSTSGNQEQDDEFDFWTDSYAYDDDEIPSKQVS